jgi:hypothetical protein
VPIRSILQCHHGLSFPVQCQSVPFSSAITISPCQFNANPFHSPVPSRSRLASKATNLPSFFPLARGSSLPSPLPQSQLIFFSLSSHYSESPLLLVLYPYLSYLYGQQSLFLFLLLIDRAGRCVAAEVQPSVWSRSWRAKVAHIRRVCYRTLFSARAVTEITVCLDLPYLCQS